MPIPQEKEIQQFWTDHPMILPGHGFSHRQATPEEVFAHMETMMRDKGALHQAPGAPLMSRYVDYAGLRGKPVLEIGFGVGWFLKEFVGAGAEAHGIDLSKSH